MNNYTAPESFLSLLFSAVAMTFGLLILARQLLLMAYSHAGWTAVGVVLTLIAVGLFRLHIWLEETIPRVKNRYGR